jgi:hypothetical protein
MYLSSLFVSPAWPSSSVFYLKHRRRPFVKLVDGSSREGIIHCSREGTVRCSRGLFVVQGKGPFIEGGDHSLRGEAVRRSKGSSLKGAVRCLRGSFVV